MLEALKVWMGDWEDEEVKEEGRGGGGVVTIPLRRRELGWREGERKIRTVSLMGLGDPNPSNRFHSHNKDVIIHVHAIHLFTLLTCILYIHT